MTRLTWERPVRGALLISACATFYLFSYNSGYGYDALEYLLIGRSMAEGVPLYTYLPSKSPALYYLIAGLYRLGVDFDHASLAAVITAIYAVTVLLTYAIAQRWFSPNAAIAIATLTALAAPFMEMNFLQPTALFFMCGLVAFDGLLRFESTGRFRWLFAAGVAMGMGIAIKSTAAFYGLAAGHFLIMLWASRKNSFAWLCRCGVALGGGVLAVLALWIAYFWTQGRADAFIEWTFTFPFAHYPSSTTYIAKAYTKLLWVHAFILGCTPLLLRVHIRNSVWRHPPAVLALLFGVCAYPALLKTQASHYFFPGAPFLMMFAVAVYAERFKTVTVSARVVVSAVGAAAALVIVLAASVVFYRPDAVTRLTSLKDFAKDERPVREHIQANVEADEYVLITGGTIASTWSYWISHRYPPPPFINMDVKTIWMLRNRPEDVFGVLDNPRLRLVQFEEAQLDTPTLEDVFGNLPQDRFIMREYLARVMQRFERAQPSTSPATFWRRNDLPAATAAAKSYAAL